MKPASRARSGPRATPPRGAPGGESVPLLAEIAEIAAEEKLEPALARLARLLTRLGGAEAAAVFLTDAGEPTAAGWHPAAGALAEGLRGEIERVAREAAKPGPPPVASMRDTGAGVFRTFPLAAAGRLHGVACVFSRAGRGAAKRLADPSLATALAL